MIALGEFSLKLSFALSVYAVMASATGIRARVGQFLVSANRAINAAFILLSISLFVMVYALITRNYELKYVAENVSNNLPVFYAATALWAGQAGSLLFWAWLLALFSAIAIAQNRTRNLRLIPYVEGTLSIILGFFTFLLVFISNPFERLGFAISDGKGLNPLLQNPGMAFHPPLLYIGYVGFSIPFAFAIAALITRRLDDQWIRSTRRWTIFSWLFLTIGILLGAKWAYVELGWGGYWGWDPVENASLMPWLTATAYLHSVMIQERKGMLKIWNVSLIFITFLLTVFGTFVTRSGLISSVHSFGRSTLGPAFLVFMLALTGAALYLILTRQQFLKSRTRLDSFLSRESSFLFNNLILLAATFAILWGTLFPMISEAVRGIKITVGPPFFNTVTIPIALALLLLTGVCPLISWRKASLNNFMRNFLVPSAFLLISLAALYAAGIHNLYSLLSFSLSVFVTVTIVTEFYRGTKARMRHHGEGLFVAFGRLVAKYRRRYAGYIVHVGMIFIFVGVTGSSAFKVEKEQLMKKGDTLQIQNYRLTFEGLNQYRTANAQVAAATLRVQKGGKDLGLITPSKHYHFLQKQTMTEVAILSSLREDLYLILGSINKDGTVLIKAFINPLVAWIWLGGYVIILGGIILLWPSRRRRAAYPAETAAVPQKAVLADR